MMKQVRLGLAFTSLLPVAWAQVAPAEESTRLSELWVYSPRVALQQPVGTFAMPVSALRFEPLVDVQARNLAEGQADVAIRGGTFENTGFKLGTLSMYDPLTGHYFAEIPVSPSLLTAPQVLVGYDNAVQAWNATTGTVAYGWRPIRTQGSLSFGAGQYDTYRSEAYQGWQTPFRVAGRALSADASWSTSQSDGSRPWGEHDFERTNVRFQLVGQGGQTDLMYGYQAKQFGWPNLYTPFANVFEEDRLQTAMGLLHHHQKLAGDDFFNVGAYWRRNKDHYVFNRAENKNPAFPTAPNFHTGYSAGLGFDGQWTQDSLRWVVNGTWVSDKIRSTSLNFGRYRARDQYRLTLVPERTWALAEQRQLRLQAGAAWDDSNRTSGRVSPVARLTWENSALGASLKSVFLSYSEATQLPTYTALNSRPTAGLFRGNAGLGRQVSRNVELGSQVVEGPWSVHASVFFRRDERLVDWTYASSLPNARAANAVDIDNLGAEVVARYAATHWEVSLGYTALGKEEDYGLATVDASFYALNYARHRATAAATWRFLPGWELRCDNEYRIQEKDTLRRTGRSAFLTSAGLYWSPAATPGLRLGVEVENAWDDDFQEVPAVPSTRRQVGATLAYSW